MSIKLKRVLASVVSLAMLVTFINIPAVTSVTLADATDSIPDVSTLTDGVNYQLNSSTLTATVSEAHTASGDIVIYPKVMSDGLEYKVTSIAQTAFAGSSITSIVIPGSVSIINPAAFVYVDTLKTVELNEGTSIISDSAFAGCTSLDSIVLPNSLTVIGNDAFAGCASLEFLRIPVGCSSPHVWASSPKLSIEYPCTEIAGYTVADGCTAIPYHLDLTVSDDGFTCSSCNKTGYANCIGHSITLDSMIGVNFYYEIPDCILSNPVAYVRFTCNGEPYYSTPISSYEIYNYIDNSNEEPVDRTCYIYSCPVAAKQMTDVIEAQIVVPLANLADGITWTSSVESYSVVEYAGRLSSYDFNDSALNNVVKSMLIYGACAQEYFDYHTDRLAYALDTRDAFVNAVVNGIDDFPVEGTSLIFSNFGRMVTTQGPENGVQMVAADLILGSTTSMGLYFTVPEELADSTITYSVNGVNYDARRVGDRMYIRVNDIQPFNLVAAYPIEVSINGAPQSEYPMLFSPSAYAYLVAEMVDDSAATPSLQNLMRAMFLFGAYSYSYNK